MKEFEYYQKNENDTYAFFYNPDEKITWAVHMPKLPSGMSGMGREVATIEGINTEEEVFEKLKEAVDKL